MKKIIGMILIGSLFLGGCSMGEPKEPKGYSGTMEDQLMASGTIDPEEARAKGFVGADELKAEYNSDINSEMRKYADEHYDEIVQYTKEYVEPQIQNEIEVLRINAIYPYSSVEIQFKTVSEPVIYISISLGLSNNAYSKSWTFHDYPETYIKQATVERLYMLAYDTELKALDKVVDEANDGTFLRIKPEDKHVESDVSIPLSYMYMCAYPSNFDKGLTYESKDFSNEVYSWYIENKSVDEMFLRRYFEENGITGNIGTVLFLSDPTVIPTVEMVETIATNVREHDIDFQGTYYFVVTTYFYNTVHSGAITSVNASEYKFVKE